MAKQKFNLKGDHVPKDRCHGRKSFPFGFCQPILLIWWHTITTITAHHFNVSHQIRKGGFFFFNALGLFPFFRLVYFILLLNAEMNSWARKKKGSRKARSLFPSILVDEIKQKDARKVQLVSFQYVESSTIVVCKDFEEAEAHRKILILASRGDTYAILVQMYPLIFCYLITLIVYRAPLISSCHSSVFLFIIFGLLHEICDKGCSCTLVVFVQGLCWKCNK